MHDFDVKTTLKVKKKKSIYDFTVCYVACT